MACKLKDQISFQLVCLGTIQNSGSGSGWILRKHLLRLSRAGRSDGVVVMLCSHGRKSGGGTGGGTRPPPPLPPRFFRWGTEHQMYDENWNFFMHFFIFLFIFLLVKFFSDARREAHFFLHDSLAIFVKIFIQVLWWKRLRLERNYTYRVRTQNDMSMHVHPQ